MSEKKSLKEKLAELEALVTWFERDDIEIEQAIEKFETGSQLSKEIRDELGEFENKITVLKQSFEDDRT